MQTNNTPALFVRITCAAADVARSGVGRAGERVVGLTSDDITGLTTDERDVLASIALDHPDQKKSGWPLQVPPAPTDADAVRLALAARVAESQRETEDHTRRVEAAIAAGGCHDYIPLQPTPVGSHNAVREAAHKRWSDIRRAREAAHDAEKKAQKEAERAARKAEAEAYIATLDPRVAEAVRVSVSNWTEFEPANLRYRAEAITLQIEQEDWIAAHGSDRLRRCAAEGVEHDAIYRDERLRADRPGWTWERQVIGYGEEPRNPPLSAFTLLDEARKTDPDAVLRRWVIEATEDENGEEAEPRWVGYVASGRFLGPEIIFGAPVR